MPSVGVCTGSSSVIGVSSVNFDYNPTAVGTSAGSSSVSAVGLNGHLASGLSEGSSSVSSVGLQGYIAQGISEGLATVEAIGRSLAEASANIVQTSSLVGISTRLRIRSGTRRGYTQRVMTRENKQWP